MYGCYASRRLDIKHDVSGGVPMTRFGYVDHHWVAIFVLRHIRRDRIEGRYRKRSWRAFTGPTQIQAIEGAVEPVRRGFVQGPLRSGRATDEETGRRVGDYGLLQLLSRDSQRLGLEVVVVVVRIVGADSRRKLSRPRLGE